jgi:hypothetical protein
VRPRTRSTTTKSFVARRPLAFCLLVSLVLFGLTAMSAIVLPRTVISSVEGLSPELRLEPSDLERALTVLVSPENLFRVLAILLAVALLGRLGWGHETGFNRPSRSRNLHLLLLPFLFVTLTLLGGIRFPGGPAVLVAMLLAALLTAFSEELLYRGLIWRAPLPTGLMRTVVALRLTKKLHALRYPRLEKARGDEPLPSMHVGTSSGLRTTRRASAATPTLTSSLRTISSCSSTGSCQSRGGAVQGRTSGHHVEEHRVYLTLTGKRPL